MTAAWVNSFPEHSAPMHLRNDAAQPRKCRFCLSFACTNPVGQEAIDLPRHLLESPVAVNLPLIARDTRTEIEHAKIDPSEPLVPVVIKGHMDQVLLARDRIRTIISR
jgi:hypothetical protein